MHLPLEMHGIDLFEIWRRFDGIYECLKDDEGVRKGPLVVYTSEYDAPDGTKKRFVGDDYFNFAKVEARPRVLDLFACRIADELKKISVLPHTVIGAPMGGIFLAGALARELDCLGGYAEKIPEWRGDMKQIGSRLLLSRHAPSRGARVVIVEDVCNTFATAISLIKLIKEKEATVCAVVCALNRSAVEHIRYKGKKIPVISAIYLPAVRYRQEDPEVAGDVQSGNVRWDPKNEWDHLIRAMRSSRTFS